MSDKTFYVADNAIHITAEGVAKLKELFKDMSEDEIKTHIEGVVDKVFDEHFKELDNGYPT